jgi:hypothetical protein
MKAKTLSEIKKKYTMLTFLSLAPKSRNVSGICPYKTPEVDG